MWYTHQIVKKNKQTHDASYLPDAALWDGGGPGQEEQETGQTALATFVTIKDYDNSDGYEEEW